jgi:hypothetical protein
VPFHSRAIAFAVLVLGCLATEASSDHWWRCQADYGRPYKYDHNAVWGNRSANAGEAYASAWSAGVAAWEDNTIMQVWSEPFPAMAGQVDMESGYYGYTPWLGLASPYDLSEACTFRKVLTQINATHADNYDQYVRNAAACHELGHAWGLGHRDSEPGVQSCMGAYHLPDAHDKDTIHWLYGVSAFPGDGGGSGGGGGGSEPCLNGAGNLAPYCTDGCSASRPCDKKCRLADETCSTCGQYGSCDAGGGSGGGGGGSGGSNNLVCFPNLSECEAVCGGVCERRLNCGSANAHKCFE